MDASEFTLQNVEDAFKFIFFERGIKFEYDPEWVVFKETDGDWCYGLTLYSNYDVRSAMIFFEGGKGLVEVFTRDFDNVYDFAFYVLDEGVEEADRKANFINEQLSKF